MTVTASDFSPFIDGNLPFALYRLPGSDELTFLGQTSNTLFSPDGAEDWQRARGFVVSPFSTQEVERPVVIQPDVWTRGQELSAELIDRLARVTPAGKQVPTSTAQADHLAAVERAVHEMRTSRLQKVVLSRIDVMDRAADWQPGTALRALAERYPRAFVYFFHLPGQATWMGATPETLLWQSEAGWETMALAGTQPAGPDPSTAHWGEKEREEQQLVTDFIADALNSAELTNFRMEGPTTVQAAQVWHLQ